MKAWELNRRTSSLSEKLKSVPCEGVRVDFDSFPEPEKLLLRRVFEIEEKYGSAPPADVIEANAEIILKAMEVISWRVLELFMFVMSETLGCDEIKVWFFKLHLYNFFEDLKECLKNVRKWSEKDREEFLRDMKESGMLNKVFRIPRGLNEHNTVKDEDRQKGNGDD